jgi:hypothetical protein
MATAAPPFRHLLRLTDRVGLLEHADGVVPLILAALAAASPPGQR